MRKVKATQAGRRASLMGCRPWLASAQLGRDASAAFRSACATALLLGCACLPRSPSPRDSVVSSPAGRIDRHGQDTSTRDRSFAAHESAREPRLSARVERVKLSPDASFALVQFFYTGEGSRSGDREPLKLFEMDGGREVRGLKGLSLDTLDFLPGGKLLGRGPEGGLAVWDTVSGQKQRTFPESAAAIDCLAVSPDARYVLTAGHLDGNVQGWSVPRGQLLWTRERASGQVRSIVFQPNGPLAFLRSDGANPDVQEHRGAVRLWNIVEGKPVAAFNDRQGWSRCAFSPDGRSVVADQSVWRIEDPKKDRLVLAEVPAGKELRRFAERTGGAAGSGAAYSLTFTPDGKRVVSVDSDFLVRLWDVRSGETIWSIDYRSAPWGWCPPAVSSDGKLALSVAVDYIGSDPKKRSTGLQMRLRLRLWHISGSPGAREMISNTTP